jgi:prephenate dehydratase/chorismate mutase
MNPHLEALRKRIDRIDYEILKLFKERTETAMRTRRHKTGTEDSGREKNLIKRVKELASQLGLLDLDMVERIYLEILAASKSMQEKGYELIAFQGEHGAYGEVAARKYNKDMVAIPVNSFADVFEAVQNKKVDFGIVPVENTLGGAITEVNELFIESEVQLIGEIYNPIHHCLLAPAGTDHKDIRVVYSHPQALSQCRGFLQRTKLEPKAYYDTAGAAKLMASEVPEASAAIASELCAELYNLDVVKENIEDHKDNRTRFLVLAPKDYKVPEGKLKKNKYSLLFSVKDKAGALFEVLKSFTDEKINLTRIESMPNRERPGSYYFFLDFIEESKDVNKIMEFVQEHTIEYKFLGAYPAGLQQ